MIETGGSLEPDAMKSKVKYGQFYTRRAQYIIGNLIGDLDGGLEVVEPFCGEGDLLIFENQCRMYDIDPKIPNCEKRDTLLDPPDYTGKLVVTNPPFLARNKNKDKTIYDKFEVGDLYKAAVKSIMPCAGGILIIPLNFLCDEDNKTRDLFFSRFEIVRLNIFEETVFDDTTYTICSFSFRPRIEPRDHDTVACLFLPGNDVRHYDFKATSGWRIGSDFLEIINNTENIGVRRLKEGMVPNSSLHLRAIDTGTTDGRISLSIRHDHFYGKESDRTFASLVMNRQYTHEEEVSICREFNRILEVNREKYKSMFLTNFRNSTCSYARKRMSFDMAYRLVSHVVKALEYSSD